jgi:hypothetical protein
MTTRDLGGHHKGAGVTARVLGSAPAESGVAARFFGSQLDDVEQPEDHQHDNDHANDSDATASGVHFDLPFSNQEGQFSADASWLRSP